MHWARALKTIANLFNGLSGVAKVSLASSSFYSHLISVLVAVSFVWGVKTLIVFLSEVFMGPVTALLATVFCNIIIKMLGNSK